MNMHIKLGDEDEQKSEGGLLRGGGREETTGI